MRPDTSRESIRCDYTPEEMVATASALAERVNELQALREAKKASDATFNSQIEVVTTAVISLAKKYSKGYEMRELDCDIRYNTPEPGKKTIYRTDTAEAIQDMTWEEKQEEMQFNLPPEKPPETEIPPPSESAPF